MVPRQPIFGATLSGEIIGMRISPPSDKSLTPAMRRAAELSGNRIVFASSSGWTISRNGMSAPSCSRRLGSS